LWPSHRISTIAKHLSNRDFYGTFSQPAELASSRKRRNTGTDLHRAPTLVEGRRIILTQLCERHFSGLWTSQSPVIVGAQENPPGKELYPARKDVRFTLDCPLTNENYAASSNNFYDFTANVDPTVPHPRWSQATEKLIDTGERRPTLPYNGYGEWLANLYT
jgi:hypothetical protein